MEKRLLLLLNLFLIAAFVVQSTFSTESEAVYSLNFIEGLSPLPVLLLDISLFLFPLNIPYFVSLMTQKDGERVTIITSDGLEYQCSLPVHKKGPLSTEETEEKRMVSVPICLLFSSLSFPFLSFHPKTNGKAFGETGDLHSR